MLNLFQPEAGQLGMPFMHRLGVLNRAIMWSCEANVPISVPLCVPTIVPIQFSKYDNVTKRRRLLEVVFNL